MPLRPDLAFEAQLYVLPSDVGRPEWQSFLEQGTAVPLTAVQSAVNGAVLLVRVPRDEGDRWVAFAFGLGQELLERDRLEGGFGLRVCLNLAYPRGEALDAPTLPPRLKTINAKTIEEATDETRRRASRSVPLENFGLDVRRDLMAGVAAYPADSREWGKVVQGATPFRHSRALEFQEIGDHARRLVEVWSRDDFRDRFSFIEHIRPIDDERVNVLESIVLHLLASEDHGGFDLVPPEDLGSENVAGFKLPEEAGTFYNPELNLADYLKYVGNSRLDIERLIDDRIRAVDSRGQVLGRAPVFDFLTGQVVHDGRTYVLAQGLFYEVDEDFLNELTADIQTLPRYAGSLPPWRLGGPEAAYNETAARSRDLLPLDTRTLRPAGRTSGVKVCDLLSRDGALLHVAKKSRSSTLSHLFRQGLVSAELLVRDASFRHQLVELVDDVEQRRAADDEAFATGFKSLFSAAGATPGRHEIVFVIIGDWKGQASPLSLPFFSQVNLRQRAEDLRAIGFRVTCAYIAPMGDRRASDVVIPLTRRTIGPGRQRRSDRDRREPSSGWSR